ncbi:MAG: hypothetical protein AMK73_09395 [Planctomycetes bacterium SM23_32]|nr:MAG: hypothetical protein AMK73_09395 [Planctomycetes bacterium SM23_32]
MILGTVQIRLRLADARSLKDKRRILLSLKDRLRRDFNVSVAEVDNQDIIQSAVLAVAQVGNDSRYINGTLDRVVQAVRRLPTAQLVDYAIELL